MRSVKCEKFYFVFHDTDGRLSFTLPAYDGEPDHSRFVFDGTNRAFFMRREEQIVALPDLQTEIVDLLGFVKRVRMAETPEDSSEIVRQYDVPVIVVAPLKSAAQLKSATLLPV